MRRGSQEFFDMNMLLRAYALFFAFLLSIAPAAAHDYKVGDLIIVHPWSRATPAGAKVAAGYVTIHNKGGVPERLVSIASDISDKAEIHEMAVDGKGVMTMRPVAGGIEIPAGGQAVLKPGSFHVMFMGLKRQAAKGERFAATFTFEKAGPVEIEFMVMDMAGGEDEHKAGGHGG
jgi:copper(I)-binding protein